MELVEIRESGGYVEYPARKASASGRNDRDTLDTLTKKAQAMKAELREAKAELRETSRTFLEKTMTESFRRQGKPLEEAQRLGKSFAQGRQFLGLGSLAGRKTA